MAAGTPGHFVLVGQTGQTYSYAAWFTDAVGAAMRFDAGNGIAAATDGVEFATFNETVTIKDIIVSAVSTPTALTFRLTLNGKPTSQTFRISNQLATIVFRQPINLTLPAGSRLGGIMTT